ncbi:SDR family oxidoreductase [Micromonospora soli]|uniref:SDR family NAD(P)-dependent oxidoreductase n=1 Tax=Micromonospora sp. NBRC 110009 TaxID=3061627 RepID=UPI0026722176|nr:SDR family oxidoreductase [Micromonospora sp. NBRC 110009]WKU00452.1 SDR family oxidoreductase [Micromonospora sp. NBRC 110009]
MTGATHDTVDARTTRPVLDGRRVLVTGGTRGVGRAVVLTMARAGASVVSCYRQPGAAVDSLRAELGATSGDHGVVRADVRHDEDVRDLIDECRARLGGLDVVVNNVGAFAPKPYAELSRAEWNATVDGNLTSAHLVTQAALPLLSAGSSVINVGSTVTSIGMSGGAHYTAAKAALVGFTRSLARELGPAGIRVNVISPGRIDTEAMDELPPELAARQRALFASFNALGRLGGTAEVASVALFLASPAAGYVTGQNIHVDGCV